MKTCRSCLTEKSEDLFYKYKRVCKPCLIAKSVEYTRNASPEKKADRNAKQLVYQKTPEGRLAGLRAKFKYRYGITLEQYEALFKEQGGVCYLCGGEETVPHHKTDTIMRLAVDHDHKCCPGTRSCGLCIRSLLCYNCNRFMGRVDKSPKLQTRFEDYLSRRALGS